MDENQIKQIALNMPIDKLLEAVERSIKERPDLRPMLEQIYFRRLGFNQPLPSPIQKTDKLTSVYSDAYGGGAGRLGGGVVESGVVESGFWPRETIPHGDDLTYTESEFNDAVRNGNNSTAAWRRAYHLARRNMVNAFFAGLFLGVVTVSVIVFLLLGGAG